MHVAPDVPAGEPAVESWRPATVHDLLDIIRSATPAPRSGRASSLSTAAARAASLLRAGVLEPVRRGEEISYRPPGWLEHDRPGAVAVPAGLELLVVGGVGAGRREVSDLLDAVVWVQSDPAETQRRGIARDIASGENGDAEQTVAFWHEWAAQELPFLSEQAPVGTCLRRRPRHPASRAGARGAPPGRTGHVEVRGA